MVLICAALLLVTKTPVFIYFFFALREMTTQVPSMTTEGFFWFHDLSVSDPYYRLPCIMSVLFLLTLECNAANSQQSRMQIIMKRVFQGFAVLLIPLTGGMSQVRDGVDGWLIG
jgi:membrane protein insertase Oxa1/YidC/SpoIIIJ